MTLKWKCRDETRNVTCTTIGSNTSREPYKTLDICDSCYKEHIDVQINVEKKKFKATSKTYRETPRSYDKLLTKAPTKIFKKIQY